MKGYKKHPVIILIFLAILFASTQLMGEAKQSVGNLSFFIGDVRLRPEGQSTWDKAKLNQALFNGQAIRTGAESRAELTLLDHSIIRIGENAIFKLENLAMDEGKLSGETKLPFGKMWSNMQKLGKTGMQVKSPNAVMAIRGTTFRADANSDSSLDVWVYEGQVDVNTMANLDSEQSQQNSPPPQTQAPAPGGPPVPVAPPVRVPVPGPYEVTLQEWLQITAGMKLSLRADGRYAHEKFDEDKDKQDSWVEWNLQRDAALK